MQYSKRKYRSISKIKSNVKKFNLIRIFFSIITCILGIICIILGIFFKENVRPIYEYEAQKNSDYKVLLKPNDFYMTQELPSGCYYAAKSINNFIIDFIYDFKSNQKSDIDLKYNITAEIVGKVQSNDGQEEKIWSKNFSMLSNESKLYKDNFTINEEVSIDYEYYNNLARSYEEKYEISIDAVLKIRFDIEYNVNLSKLNLNTKTINDYIELDIDLTDTVTKVNKNYEDINNNSIFNEENNNNIFFLIGTFLIIIFILISIINLKQNKKTPYEKYKNNIKRVLKYYKELIVTVANEPNLDDLKIMTINSLDDLIDVAEQNNKSIILYEIVKNQKSNLYVIINNYVYIYTITSEELL